MRLAFTIATLFAIGFAVFEIFGRWRLLPCRVLPCRPQILGLMPYHILIVIPLLILVSIVCTKAEGRKLLSSSSLLFAGSIFAFMLVLEDVLYFLISGYPITPRTFTTQYGYIATGNAIIPIWYFAAGACAVLLLCLARFTERHVLDLTDPVNARKPQRE